MPTPKELHVCAGLNACYQHGRSGTNACAGTGDCATVFNENCHGNNNCRGQGGCGGGGSLGSQQTAPGDNLCAGKGSCQVPAVGIEANRTMVSTGELGEPNANTAITGIYEGRHVWQVARLLFEQRMMAQGRSFTNNPDLLGQKPPADSFSAATYDYVYFGPPPKGSSWDRTHRSTVLCLTGPCSRPSSGTCGASDARRRVERRVAGYRAWGAA
jgi:hypothetical protein